MTRLEKIFMAVIILLVIGTIVFWNDVSTVFNKKETVVENEPKKDKKEKKKKKDDDGKKKDAKDEAGINFSFITRIIT